MQDELEKFGDAAKNTTELLKLFYDDLAKPGVAQVGQAIGNTLKFCFTPLMFLRFVPDVAELFLKKHLDRYRERMSHIAFVNVTSPPPEITVDILEHLTKVHDENLADLFIALLANSSNIETQSKVHPRFVHILKQISSDEARILKSLIGSDRLRINELVGKVSFQNNVDKFAEQRYLTPDIPHQPLDFPRSTNIYLGNLNSLGLVSPLGADPRSNLPTPISEILKTYPKLFLHFFSQDFNPLFRDISSKKGNSHDGVSRVLSDKVNFKVMVTKYSVSTTSFGKSFLEAIKEH